MPKSSTSILRRLRYAFLGFGLAMGLVFPFYASFFVEWKPGMLLWFCVGCIMAGITIGIVNYRLLEWLLIGKLRRVALAAARIRGGDLREGCGVRSADTVGEITEGFDAMASGLRGTVLGIANSVGSVDEAAREIGSSMQSLVDNLEEYRKNEQEVVHVIDGMADAVNSILSLSETASQHVTSTVDLVRDGVTHLEASEQAISKLDEAGHKISANAASLDSSAREVESAVSAIRDISDQTNLLALNAAIEAARAGEQGRGFAVVADEVRKLSDQARQATMRIDTVLKQVSADVASTVSISEENAEAVRAGLEFSQSSSDIFHKIEHAATGVKHAVGAVREAADDQQMLVDVVLARINENQSRADTTADLAKSCVNDGARIKSAASELSEATGQFTV